VSTTTYVSNSVRSADLSSRMQSENTARAELICMHTRVHAQQALACRNGIATTSSDVMHAAARQEAHGLQTCHAQL
jgi:hypothetical protein